MNADRFTRFLFAICLSTTPSVVAAQETPHTPVARMTIYPGDQIVDAMIDEKPLTLAPEMEPLVFHSRDGLVGKVARRTLRPGQPIPTSAVDTLRLIKTGAQVRIIFSEGGMQIIAIGVAQQAGGVGDFIRVRNQDSGLFISGRIQSDGSVLVSEG